MLIEKPRRAPGGGAGKGAARRTMFIAARSSAPDPELRAIDTPASMPPPDTLNATTTVPRDPARGRGTRDNRCITRPG